MCFALGLSFLLTGCMEHDDLILQPRQHPDEPQQVNASPRNMISDSGPLIRHRTHTDAHQSTRPPRLRWQAPLNRVNGKKIYPGEIDGYRLYYQANDESRVRIIDIFEPGNTSRVLDDFGPGDYHFSISTVDVDGQESARSGEILVSVR